MEDHLRCQRLDAAAAYHRLSDAALAAAAVYADPDAVTDELTAHAAVTGRIESVKHSRLVLAAVRRGIVTGRKAAVA